LKRNVTFQSPYRMTRCDVYIVRYGSLKTSSGKRSELLLHLIL